jgi:hypothetical protein
VGFLFSLLLVREGYRDTRRKEIVLADHPKLNMNQIRMAVLPDLLICLVGPVLIYRLAAPHMPVNDALLLAGALPLLRIADGLIRRHRLNLIGVFSLLTVVLKILLALVLKDARVMLISGSLITAIYGILLLASLLTASPLLMRLAESVLATTPSVQNAQLIQRWQKPGMRRFFTIITAVWSVGLLLECGGTGRAGADLDHPASSSAQSHCALRRVGAPLALGCSLPVAVSLSKTHKTREHARSSC